MDLFSKDSAIGFPSTYPLGSDLPSGERYPTFKQPGPGDRFSKDPETFRVQKQSFKSKPVEY